MHSFNAGPELKIRDAFVDFLKLRDWYVKVMHGNKFQSGFPDLYATHSKYRVRLIEVKDPARRGEVFTAAQLEDFPKLSANGSPIWVVTAATEIEYQKLFQPENWYQYLQVMRNT